MVIKNHLFIVIYNDVIILWNEMFCFLVPQTYGHFDPISLKEKYAEINPKKKFHAKTKKKITSLDRADMWN